MEGGKRGEKGWKGEGGERRDGRGRVGREGKQWKGGEQRREGERWREGTVRLTHLGSSSPVSIHFAFVRARSSLFAGVVSWALIIRAWGSSSCVLSFVVAVAVLGAVLLFVGSASLFVGGVHSWAVYVVRGWGADLRGLWLAYTRGVGAVVGH